MIVFNHPTGNANSRAAVEALVTEGLITKFHTSIATFPGTLFYTLGGLPAFREIRRRRFSRSLIPFTETSPWVELGRLISSKLNLERLLQPEIGAFCIDKVYQHLDSKIASKFRGGRYEMVKAIYAYEDAALRSFQECKKLGIACLYDLPIGYWRSCQEVLLLEKEKWPEWASTIVGMHDSPEKLNFKDQELNLADRIFVASNFTARTLSAYPGKLSPVTVLPYGFPPISAHKSYILGGGRKKLKLLFVGSLSQRKGIANLFSAVSKVKMHVELTVIGRRNENDCKALEHALAEHIWIPSASHEDVLKLMRSADVLVFPSLFEGFGLVITEAMSQGTPVITTDRTAGPEVIQNGVDGWIVEAGNTTELHRVLDKLLTNRSLVSEAGERAWDAASQRPWSVYADELLTEIKSHLAL